MDISNPKFCHILAVRKMVYDLSVPSVIGDFAACVPTVFFLIDAKFFFIAVLEKLLC